MDLWTAPLAGGPLDASVDVPGSKSLTNRYLVLAALADAPGRLRGALRSRDTLLMQDALTSLGARIDEDGADWVVTPGPVQGAASIQCGLAGTVMRFLPAVAAIADKAMERGTGARGLRAIIEEVLLNVMYEVPSREDIAKVVVTGEVVADNVNPTLVPREAEPKKKKSA